jgi:hypothetical protein
MNRRSLLAVSLLTPGSTLISSPSLAAGSASADHIRDTLYHHIWANASDARYLLVGETHGTFEMPQIFFGLVEFVSIRKDRLIIGLEYLQSDEAALNSVVFTQGSRDFTEFVASLKALRTWSNLDTRDGRTSIAMAQLLWQLQLMSNRRGGGVEIVCIGGSDRLAVGRLKDKAPSQADAMTLTLTGSLHATKRELPEPLKSQQGSTIGNLLKNDKSYSMQLIGLSGAAWMCHQSASNCAIHEIGPPLSSVPCKAPLCFDVPPLESGFDLVVRVRQVSPASPA